MPAKSLASGLLPCGVEITPPRTVDLVGKARLVVVFIVVDVNDWFVDDEEVVAWPDVVADPLVDIKVVVTDDGAGGEAKLMLIDPCRMLSSMVGSRAVL